MPTKRPYQYQPGDSPLTVANQFNLQPQQIISANPGGYPFSAGQTINIPSAAVNPYAPTLAAQGTSQPRPAQQATGIAGLAIRSRPVAPGTYNGTPNMAQPLPVSGANQPYWMNATNRPSTPVPGVGVQGGYQGLTPGSSTSFESIYNRLSTLTPEEANAQLAT